MPQVLLVLAVDGGVGVGMLIPTFFSPKSSAQFARPSLSVLRLQMTMPQGRDMTDAWEGRIDLGPS